MAGISAALKPLPPGTYRVAELAVALSKAGAISWGTNWSTVKHVLGALPEWSWNGQKYQSKSAWVKAAPEPKAIMPPQPRPHMCEPVESHKGPITLSLGRIESMVTRLCAEWKIPTDEVPTPVTNNPLQVEALTKLLAFFQDIVSKRTGYIKRHEVEYCIVLIRKALN